MANGVDLETHFVIDVIMLLNNFPAVRVFGLENFFVYIYPLCPREWSRQLWNMDTYKYEQVDRISTDTDVPIL